MPIYRQAAARLGEQHIKEWRRRGGRALGLLILTTAVCALGLSALDASDEPFGTRLFHGVWNAMNLITTLGAFTDFDARQKLFMLCSMVVIIVIGGYALTGLGGLLSNEAVMALRENRTVKAQLDHISGHVIVIGFGPLGQIVATRLRDAGDTVVIIEREHDLVTQASEEGYVVVEGEFGDGDETMKLAGVDRARACVVAYDDADRKLTLTLMVHSVNPKLKIAVTGVNQYRADLLRRAGGTDVIVSEALIADALLSRICGARAVHAPSVSQATKTE
jgi:voltage-gated potassium channel Kch